MKNKTIYFLRHGQTELNRQGMVQGRGVDASLNENGRRQANQVFHFFKDFSFDAIYTSELRRSQETVASLTNSGITTHALEGFDEISWGKLEGVRASIEEKNQYSDTVMAWRRGELDRNVGGGESPLDVMDRQKRAMQVVMNDDGEKILVCMHGRAMRILLCWLLNYPLNYMDGFPHENCCYYKLFTDGSVFSVVEFNQTHHLSEVV